MQSFRALAIGCVLSVGLAGAAKAQTPKDLEDLLGARAGQAEGQVTSRGYEWTRTMKAGGSAYSYWARGGECVQITTTDGRYAGIDRMARSLCRPDAAENEPPAASPLAEDVDAKVPGTNFHAMGSVSCSRGAKQPKVACKAGVVRKSDGSAEVTVLWPDGWTRHIYFGPAGRVVGSDAQAAPTAMRRGDLSLISIGDERYEVPDALPYGG